MTAKPFLYVFNMDTSELGDDDLRKRLSALVAPAEAIFLDAKTEADLAELPVDEAAELLAEAGLGEPGLAQLARAGFRALGLQTFLTAGPKETRAWEIKAGATAPEAAGVIHTDFQRGFIKAEVVSFDDLIAAGSLPAARARARPASRARITSCATALQRVADFRGDRRRSQASERLKRDRYSLLLYSAVSIDL